MSGGGGIRAFRLRKLHEDAVGLFIDSYGFGVARVSPYPTSSNLAYGLRADLPLSQPGPRGSSAGSPGEWVLWPADGQSSFDGLHDVSVVDFVHPQGFGYVRDRRHVAGFQPHRFSEVPRPKDRWKVQTLDLVGLLLHDEPRVYVSAHLPRMDELRGATTRSLDRFEAVALEAIRAGDDFMVARDGDVTRMLGAIRSTKQCVACHGGRRGDLLGAFTYTLRQAGEKVSAVE